MRIDSKWRISARLVLTAWLLSAGIAWGQTFPWKPLRLLVPYPPGATVDFFTRALADGLTPALGQPVVVDNRGGGGGTIAAANVAQSAKDGHTLLVADVAPLSIHAALFHKLPYDPIRDFEAITLGTTTTLAITVNAAVPANSVAELIALAKKQPGKLNFSHGGPGTIIHIAGEWFNQLYGTQIQQVPYKGGTASATAVLSGEVQMSIPSLPTVVPHARAGKVRILAVTQSKRSPLAPDVPSAPEAGVGEFEVSVWQGVVAPRGTPKETIARLNREIVAYLNRPEVRTRFAAAGMDVQTSTPEAFTAMIQSEAAKWKKVVDAAKITVE